jgi:hypothetical protein
MKIGITIDDDNVVRQVALCISDTHIPFVDGVTLETDLDTTTIVDNYKYEDGTLTELTDDEQTEFNTVAEVVVEVEVTQEEINTANIDYIAIMTGVDI